MPKVKTVIASPHLGSKWKKIQSDFVELYTTDYKLFQYDVPNCSHLTSLDKCLKLLSTKSTDGDLLVIMDSDAFPIMKWQERVLDYLKENEFVAVQRLENPYNPEIAHPCFCAWTFGTEMNFFANEHFNPFVVGWEKRTWKKLCRTNIVNLHTQLYGIYDKFFYHHGAGSRDVSRQPFFSWGLQRFDDIFINPHGFINILRGIK